MSMPMSELSLTEADLMALEADVVEGLGGIGAPMEEVGRGDKVSDVPRYLLPPEDCRFDVSEMVWGKVRSQPWWPAQIFDPADASEEALKHNYKDGFLVAYFGSHTYAWNDITTLRPYRSHFSQMSMQSSMANFANAVDCSVGEVSRRVEFGLACYCTPSDVYGSFKSQRIDNSGIREGACVADGAYGPYNMVSFEPDKLVQYLEELALSPLVGYDKLDLTVAKAQLLSFYRAKGYLELPSFSIHLGWPNIENERSCTEGTLVDVSVMGVGTPELKKRKIRGISSGKRSFSDDGLGKVKKQRSLADLMEYKEFDSAADGKDHEKVGSLSKVSGRSKKRKISSKNVDKVITPATNKSFKIGECISKVAIKLTRSPLTCKRSDRKVTRNDDVEENEQDVASDVSPRAHERQAGSGEEYSSTKEMLSQLRLAAQDPLKLHSFLPMITSFFSDYWYSSLSTKRIKKINGCQSIAKSGKSESDSDDSVNSEDGGDLDLVKDPDLISEEEAEKQFESDTSVKKDDDQLSDANIVEVTIGDVFDDFDFVEDHDLISEEESEKKLESGSSVKKDDDQLIDANVVEVTIGEAFDDFDLVKYPDLIISEQEAEKKLKSDLAVEKQKRKLESTLVVEVAKDEVVGDLDLVKDPDLIIEEAAAEKLEPDRTAKKDGQLRNANVVEVSIDEVIGDLDLGKDSDLMSEGDAEKLESDPSAKKDDDQLSNANNVEVSNDEEVGDLNLAKDPDLINDEVEKKLDSDPDLTSDDEAKNKLESDPSVKKYNDQLSNAIVAEVSVNEVVDQESCPTALILNFSEVSTLPSETDLIKVYCQYGPLVETETEITRKTNCVKVVFEKKAHAEVAFSSTGKCRMFDPAPVSYHLRYLPSLSGTTDSCTEVNYRRGEVEGGSSLVLLTEDPNSQMDGGAHDEIASPSTENGVITPECLTELPIEDTNQISQPLGSEMLLDSGAEHPSVLPETTGRDLECSGGGQPLDTGDPNYPPPQILVPITNIPLEDNGKNHLAHGV